jgi:protein-L-isoaspartate(D-aspartate) O-methyltransferase
MVSMKTEIRNKVSLYLFLILLVAAGACKESPAPQDPNAALWTHPRSEERLKERKQMVDRIRDYYGLDDKRTLDAILQVPRHWFVPENMQSPAYTDGPLPIGHGQTISQPFIVAFMTSILKLEPNDVVLEVGTGSGYQAAVLTEFTPHVYSIEIVTPLAEAAKKTLETRGYKTAQVRCGDGYQGWPEYCPFDAIIVTCAPDHIPSPLLKQLKPDGKIIIPVGDEYQTQDLILVTKDKHGKVSKQSMMPVRFVPLIRK